MQCEEPSCGKWRRVPLTVAKSMKEDEPWCVLRARSELCWQFVGLKVESTLPVPFSLDLDIRCYVSLAYAVYGECGSTL